jgi:hypothetical protein
MSKREMHTQGEWFVGEHWTYYNYEFIGIDVDQSKVEGWPTTKEIARVTVRDEALNVDEERVPGPETMANVSLIVAAPDLLAACEALLATCESEDVQEFGELPDSGTMRQARVAIARAWGVPIAGTVSGVDSTVEFDPDRCAYCGRTGGQCSH